MTATHAQGRDLLRQVERRLRDPLQRARSRRWAERHVLGGYPAYLQAVGVMLRSARLGLAELEAAEMKERTSALWDSMEHGAIGSLLDTLSWSVVRRKGESDGDYDARLAAAAATLRARLDGSARSEVAAVTLARTRVEDDRSLDTAGTQLPILSNASTVTEASEERNSLSAVTPETELLLPARDGVLRELTGLRAQRGATVTDEERFKLGKKRLERRVVEERRRQGVAA